MAPPSDIRGTRVLLVDNYSSFTQNLVHYLAELTGELPTVVFNDCEEQIDVASFDAIVLSPGPGTPERQEDFGVCAALLAQDETPVLGICLGHQGLGTSNGATLTHADEPIHGRTSTIVHAGNALFRDIPDSFEATRYHSLILRDPLPTSLECIARTSDGDIMALAHRERPQWSVQFHPESIASEYGHVLLGNFCRLARERAPSRGRVRERRPVDTLASREAALHHWEARSVSVTNAPAPEEFFEALYGDSSSAFWLDGSADDSVTYVGDASGPFGYRISYDLGTKEATFTLGRDGKVPCPSLFAFLDSLLQKSEVHAETPLGLSFVGGLVGYFGYELKGELGAVNRHESPWPDAEWLWVDRFIAYDHATRTATLVALHPRGEGAHASDAWLQSTALRLQAREPVARSWSTPALAWRDTPETYRAKIENCIAAIADGESYELCLTTQLAGAADVHGLELFRRMRARNPAPYAAYLRCHGFELASASPECFMKIDEAGNAISKPIKGTARRGATLEEDAALASALAESEKERSENLMIVDLVRHDLGHTCEVGSIEVSSLAAIESYATVHQLVSTIRGRLRSDATPLQCVAAAFPGGSMTGAPKKRSMEILDALESGPRGPYAGSIGFLSMSGAVDLSIVIRSVVIESGRVHLGVGGAITALSNAELEAEEIRLKARAQIDALEGILPRS